MTQARAMRQKNFESQVNGEKRLSGCNFLPILCLFHGHNRTMPTPAAGPMHLITIWATEFESGLGQRAGLCKLRASIDARWILFLISSVASKIIFI